jgi:enamine deaminase RidA (YjgF/YER057c/UK114 family)
MPLIEHNPPDVAAPAGLYSHGIEVPPNARWMYVTGQVGIDREGRTAPTIEGQCALAFRNLLAVLASAGMGVEDIVRINAYLIDPRYIEPYRAARDPLLKAPLPASTVLVVNQLADPSFWVEIDCVAAKAP